ncbi:30988_t:CDS:1, partial [Gigaspora margarita]
TSRVEGAHTILKRYLQISVDDLHSVYKKILLLLENQHNKIKELVEKSKTCVPHTYNIPFYARLVTNISLYALKKIHKQFTKASYASYDNPLKPCTSFFHASMGLLCAHMIQEHLANNQLLNLNDIHQHWRINYLLLQNQNVIYCNY